MNIFKLQYSWYEGEHDEVLLGKDVEREAFEKDLVRAKDFAESLLGKESNKFGEGYAVECRPEYYGQIVWYLTEKLGYVTCWMDKGVDYSVEDDDSPTEKISVIKSERKVERNELKSERLNGKEVAETPA